MSEEQVVPAEVVPAEVVPAQTQESHRLAPEDAPALAALQALLLGQFALLHDHSEGVRAIGIEADNPAADSPDAAVVHLHQMRVALRRSRSALSLLRHVFPSSVGRKFRKQLRWIGRVTGPARDIDVWLQALDAYLAPLSHAERAALAPLLAYLQSQRIVARAKLLRQLNSKRFRQTIRDWHTFLHKPYTEPDRPSIADDPITLHAAVAMELLHTKLTNVAAQVTPHTVDTAVHAMRIDVKKLRYLLTLFGPYFHQNLDPLAKPLRRLQRCLGQFNDHSVQLTAVHALLPRWLHDPATDPEFLIALGQLMGHLRAQKSLERRRFTRRFKDFCGEEGAALLVQMLGTT